MRSLIAISSTVGGGKTTLSHAVASALGDAVVVHYDDYEQATAMSRQELADWVNGGSNFDALPVGELVHDLARLKSGLSIRSPRSGRMLKPSRWIVLDTLMGRQHAGCAGLIDALVWIDLPADIALARKLKEFVESTRGESLQAKAGFAEWMDGYLDHYLNGAGVALQVQRERVRGDADLVLDGAASVARNADLILRHLQSQ